jgi:hypothetical protein
MICKPGNHVLVDVEHAVECVVCGLGWIKEPKQNHRSNTNTGEMIPDVPPRIRLDGGGNVG